MPRDWDQYYATLDPIDLTPAPLLIQIADAVPPGRALDVACGAGRNALYLARLGWKVTAVDSSRVAIGILRERAMGLPVDARTADLSSGEFEIEANAYDLICDFYYLQRDLFPKIREGVRPGGVFAGAIHLFEDTPAGRQRTRAFLLNPGELRNEFEGWRILYYSERAEGNEHRPAAQIIARRA